MRSAFRFAICFPSPNAPRLARDRFLRTKALHGPLSVGRVDSAPAFSGGPCRRRALKFAAVSLLLLSCLGCAQLDAQFNGDVQQVACEEGCREGLPVANTADFKAETSCFSRCFARVSDYLTCLHSHSKENCTADRMRTTRGYRGPSEPPALASERF
jgi:hypothetical protein